MVLHLSPQACTFSHGEQSLVCPHSKNQMFGEMQPQWPDALNFESQFDRAVN
jgi:hypothetical protein